MNYQKYLGRIGINLTKIEPNLENLNLLQNQHLLNVPFENLDIHWKNPIILDTEKFYEKIVEKNVADFVMN